MLKVRRWGILWRPLEVRLRRFTAVVACVIRLHNFCRQHEIKLPKGDVSVTPPKEVTFDDEDNLTGDFYEPEPVRSGRPSNDQAKLSLPREIIHQSLEIQGIVRPPRNVDRNASCAR